jgi:hypothetical protein
MIAKMDEEYGDASALIQKKIVEAITPILKDLESKGKLRDKADKAALHIASDADGTLRGIWKYDWM